MEINSPDQVGKDALMAFAIAIIATLIVACMTSCSTTESISETKYECVWTQN